jgi:tetratricopeptide (TPR) repeat protein
MVEEAIRHYTRAHQLFPSPKLFYVLGQAYYAAGRKQDALEAFRKFVRELESTTPLDEDTTTRVALARRWVTSLEAELATAPAPLLRAPPPGPPALRPDTAPKPAANLTATATAAPNSGKSRRFVWWAAGIGAAVATTAAILLISTPWNQRAGCPASADLGCF